jgi:hypothetical protein
MGNQADTPCQQHTRATSQKGKQLTRDQIRLMVPLQLEIDGNDPSVTVAWIDALFDRLDVDKSNTIDDDEWESLVAVLRDPFA